MTAQQLAGSEVREWSVGAGQITLKGNGGRVYADVKTALDGNVRAISTCYRAAYAKKEIIGTLTVRITIDQNGSVSNVGPEGSTDVTDAELRKCVFATYRKLKFGAVPSPPKDIATHALFFGKSTMPPSH